MPPEISASDGFSPAWKEVQRLVSVNARHRKGFRLRNLSCQEILGHVEGEFHELCNAVDRHDDGLTGTDSEVAGELADVLCVLFHLMTRFDYTPETLGRTMLDKLKERFDAA